MYHTTKGNKIPRDKKWFGLFAFVCVNAQIAYEEECRIFSILKWVVHEAISKELSAALKKWMHLYSTI